VKVILLAGSVDEARAFVKVASLAAADVVIPQTPDVLDGMRLANDDLIIEFPSFLQHQQWHGITLMLNDTIARCQAYQIPWEKFAG
jgi:sialic acid synthase SpsE